MTNDACNLSIIVDFGENPFPLLYMRLHLAVFFESQSSWLL